MESNDTFFLLLWKIKKISDRNIYVYVLFKIMKLLGI